MSDVAHTVTGHTSAHSTEDVETGTGHTSGHTTEDAETGTGCTPAVTPLRILRQENHEFKANLTHVTRSVSNTNINKQASKLK